jgi:hypothetical protein
MHAAQKLVHQVDDPDSLMAARRSVAGLVLDHLRALQLAPRQWQQVHLASAVATLAAGIDSMEQPVHAWLRLCLVDLQKSIDSIAPCGSYTPRQRHLDAVTLEELIATIEALGDQDNDH